MTYQTCPTPTPTASYFTLPYPYLQYHAPRRFSLESVGDHPPVPRGISQRHRPNATTGRILISLSLCVTAVGADPHPPTAPHKSLTGNRFHRALVSSDLQVTADTTARARPRVHGASMLLVELLLTLTHSQALFCGRLVLRELITIEIHGARARA